MDFLKIHSPNSAFFGDPFIDIWTPQKSFLCEEREEREKKVGILFLASQNRLASVTKTGSRLLVVTESNFMLQFSSFLNVFL